MRPTAQEPKELWALLFPQVELPPDPQWALWSLLHDPTTMRDGILQLATKYRKLDGQMDESYMAKFASSVMNRITGERRSAA